RKCLGRPGGRRGVPAAHVVPRRPEATAETKVVEGTEIPEGWFGMDIGPKTVTAYAAIIGKAGTVVWNGPVGKFEDEPFRAGTKGIAEAMAHAPGVTAGGGRGAAGAGEAVGVAEKVTHVSTGGGAFLEYLEGKTFNSLKAIPDK